MNLAQITSIALHLRGEDTDILFEDLVDSDITTEELADLWLRYDEWKTTANQVEKILNDELGRRLDTEDKSAYEVGEYLVFRGYRSMSEKCVDPEMFHDWLADAGWEMVRKAFNPNQARKGSLPPEVRERLFKKTKPPKAEKQAVAAPLSKIEEAKRKKELQSG